MQELKPTEGDSIMKRRRKRTLRMVLLLLTAGAIINVAVAWGCTLWIHVKHRSGSAVASVPSELLPRVPSTWMVKSGSDTRFELGYSEYGGPGIQVTYLGESGLIPHADNRNSLRMLLVLRAGWPATAVECSGTLDDPFERTAKWNQCIVAPPAWRPQPAMPWLAGRAPRPFPCLFAWPGFAINTILYAAILWLLCVAPFALRRRIRARRGQCPACAYPIGTSDVCTECGAAVMPKG